VVETVMGRRTVAEEFMSIVRSYDDRLRALAFRMVGSAEDMDDALQDAYVKAFRAYPTFRGESDPRTWLYRIVHNSCVDLLRRERRYLHDHLDPDEPAPSPPPAVDRWDLEAALAQLPSEQLAVVLLVDVEDLDYAMAADVLGIPVGTAASRLSRAHSALRGHLKEIG
jgi:RNA polymerase sigma-70 factor (ECF subfamily)